MRFADIFHERLYRVSRFNTRQFKDKEGKDVEMCSIKLENYNIYCVDYGERWGYIIEKPSAASSIYKRIVLKEPKDFKDTGDIEIAPWYIEFEILEKNLEPLLKEAEEYESKLFTIATNVSKKIAA